MAAVLARKQAEPLMAALVAKGNGLRAKAEAGVDFEGKAAWVVHPPRLPAPVAQLMQCLVEEAEAAPETLTAALQLVAFFARGCHSAENWVALSRGPYSEELLHQAWLLYAPLNWPEETWLLNSWSKFLVGRQPRHYWEGGEGNAELQRLLSSQCVGEIARGLVTYAGIILTQRGIDVPPNAAVLQLVEAYLFKEDAALSTAAAWAWGLAHRHLIVNARPRRGAQPIRAGASMESTEKLNSAVLERLTMLVLSDAPKVVVNYAAFALSTEYDIPRRAWTPVLTESQVQRIRLLTMDTQSSDYRYVASVKIAFHSGNVWSDEELAKRLVAMRESQFNPFIEASSTAMLEQLGEKGQRYLRPTHSRRRKDK